MIKTIVMHVDGAPDFAQRVAVVAQLAQAQQAHVIGAAVTGWVQLDFLVATAAPAPLAPPLDYPQARDAAQARLAAFETEARRLGLESVETRLFTSSVEDALMLQSRYCDLLVIGQVDATEGEPLLPTRLAGYLAVHATRPVLMVPVQLMTPALGGPVVIGWNASPQASRAVAAALPFLRGAENVVVAVFNPDDARGLHGDEPGADLAQYLARHGAKVDIVCTKTDLEPGEALHTLAANAGAGLIVAGAFGHSRFNEWVLGGSSASLIGRSGIPLLLAH